MKILSVRSHSTSLPEPEKRGDVRDARRLLHVVRDDDDRVAALQLVNQLLDPLGRDRVERRRRFVHQQDLGLDRQRARDAETLLLAAGERERRRRAAGPCTSSQSAARLEAGLDASAQLVLRRGHPVDAQSVGDVLEDRLGKRVRLLEHHPDACAAARRRRPTARRCRAPSIRTAPFDACARDDVVHPVERAEERGLAAARRTDEGGDLVRRILREMSCEHPVRAVIEVHAGDVDLRRFLMRGVRMARRHRGGRCHRGYRPHVSSLIAG